MRTDRQQKKQTTMSRTPVVMAVAMIAELWVTDSLIICGFAISTIKKMSSKMMSRIPIASQVHRA
jgi:hypothetical protein